MEQLIAAGFSAEDVDARGCTPLHVCRCACAAGMLLLAVAPVQALCGGGATPLHLAAGAGRMCALYTISSHLSALTCVTKNQAYVLE